jgi:hypothetical protein
MTDKETWIVTVYGEGTSWERYYPTVEQAQTAAERIEQENPEYWATVTPKMDI